MTPGEPSGRPARRAALALPAGASASELVDQRIAALADWRGQVLARVRAVVRGADPGVVEEWKWNTPVWSHAGILCTGEAYETAVKLTFAKGASLAIPRGSSTPASTAGCAGRSTFTKASRSTKPRSLPWCDRRSIGTEAASPRGARRLDAMRPVRSPDLPAHPPLTPGKPPCNSISAG